MTLEQAPDDVTTALQMHDDMLSQPTVETRRFREVLDSLQRAGDLHGVQLDQSMIEEMERPDAERSNWRLALFCALTRMVDILNPADDCEEWKDRLSDIAREGRIATVAVEEALRVLDDEEFASLPNWDRVAQRVIEQRNGVLHAFSLRD